MNMGGVVCALSIDISKRVFLSPSCRKDSKILDRTIKSLIDHKFLEKNIVKNMDMDIINSGDYLVRYLDEKMQLFEIKLTLPFGYTTEFIVNL